MTKASKKRSQKMRKKQHWMQSQDKKDQQCENGKTEVETGE